MRRRDFLRIALSATASLAVAPAATLAQASDWVDHWWDGDDHDGSEPPAAVKPGGRILAPGSYCAGKLCLRSASRGEAGEFVFRDTSGNYDKQTIAALNWFLRCNDGSWQYMDIRTIESLNYLSAILGNPEILVTSGYRSPAYNARLALSNESVARNSLHQYGQAVDFTIYGMNVRELCSYALYARNRMGYGGVGYYPRANFVHLDCGRVRNWVKG